jgi:starch phosphorylase
MEDELTKAVDSIIKGGWDLRAGQVIPETDAIALGNSGVTLEATVLYADLADSTELALFDQEIAAEVYKAYLLGTSRLIKAAGGEIRSFDGDRVMGVFIGNSKNTSAAKAALKINYFFTTVLQPASAGPCRMSAPLIRAGVLIAAELTREDVATPLPADAIHDDSLAQLALDLRWTWSHATDELWHRVDPELWDLTHNPWVILQTVSQQRLERVLADPGFQQMLDAMTQARLAEPQKRRWFHTAHPNSPLKTAAYFCMEYMLSEALPLYAGGLGNVAGDQLKTVSELGVPLVAVGLLYQQGYFRQEIDRSGAQIASYPFNDPGQLPITPLREGSGDWLRVKIGMPGGDVWIRTWQAQVGCTKLFLLDTNDPANFPHYRGITGQLYGGGPDLRLKQEMVLGIGGWRLLRALGISPEVCHLNEGHTAFAVLERARSFMEDTGRPFAAALAATRAGNLFTTHTGVEAGFDRFSPEAMRIFFAGYAEDQLKISFHELMALGRTNADDEAEPFNMANLAIRGSSAVNGVSRLHEQVSRRILQPLFPRWPASEVPVQHITNGIHVPTWDSAAADRLWTDACGAGRWRGDLQGIEQYLRSVDDAQLWRMRGDSRRSLIAYARRRYARQLASRGEPAEQIAKAQQVLDPDALTLCFARRFAPYKRPTLLLHDPDRLARILTNSSRPVQLILAGKAHPQDVTGQAMIRQWNSFLRRPDVASGGLFLADYDMLLTEQLVAGADVWISTSRRPLEASGTSGMKALVNGGLNVSELDGWWAEAYMPEVGWALGDGNERGDDPAWDAAEANALYELLEREIIHQFYTRDARDVAPMWVAKMRESMARLTPRFSANRMVREYTDNHYVRAAVRFTRRAAKGGELGAALAQWQQDIQRHWNDVRFGPLRVVQEEGVHVFEVQVSLGGLDPGAVRVELFAEGIGGGEPFRQPMDRGAPCDCANNSVYSARVPAIRSARDFTPRVLPYHPDALVPLEAKQILWQK